ncbi:S-layer homology domain-containing protein [Bacillus tuaregi]|uniref:S-layer homology domain-containing protein n=1 Tax=Bacillus tuaregi TaxID=1816695 RepID=UPI0008F905C8|nr:S-layer homology domain-containing protein [Bacillus tuaregi]
MRKWFLSIVGLFFLFNCFNLSAAASSFTDLPSSHKFYQEIAFLQHEKIIDGYPDHTVRPEADMTRAEAAIMLGRALKINGSERSTIFTDVPSEHIASGFIGAIAEAGVMKGFPDGTFRPNQMITRAQTAIILSRAFNLTEESHIPFTDLSPTMESYLHIKIIIANNLTQGFEDNTFRPYLYVTRAHFSAFLARALHDDFKVELPLIFLKDPSKVYHYHYENEGDARYVYSHADDDWNLWQVYHEDGSSYSIVEKQDSEGYKFGYPYSEYSIEVAQPVEVGHKWDGYGDIPDYYQITAVDLSMTTPAGTFDNVVEVTRTDGYVSYFAPTSGMIKVTRAGTTIAELIEIE